jgi:hypothetical protein
MTPDPCIDRTVSLVAHQFYEQLGYVKSRASCAFELTLGQAGSNPSVKEAPISGLRPLAAEPCVER